MPAFVDFQASRNLGAGKHRDARMVSANVGSVKKFGGKPEGRFLESGRDRGQSGGGGISFR